MKQTSICEDVQPETLRHLAARVCLQAIRDIRGDDPLAGLDAFFWLTGPDFGFWAEAAGIPFGDPLAVLTGGRLQRKAVRHAKHFAAA